MLQGFAVYRIHAGDSRLGFRCQNHAEYGMVFLVPDFFATWTSGSGFWAILEGPAAS